MTSSPLSSVAEETFRQTAFSVPQVFSRWGVSARHVYDLCAHSELGHLRIGNLLDTLENWKHLRPGDGTPRLERPNYRIVKRGTRFLQVRWWEKGHLAARFNGADRAPRG